MYLEIFFIFFSALVFKISPLFLSDTFKHILKITFAFEDAG